MRRVTLLVVGCVGDARRAVASRGGAAGRGRPLPAQRELPADRRPRSGHARNPRQRPAHLAQYFAQPDIRTAISPVLECLARRELLVDARAAPRAQSRARQAAGGRTSAASTSRRSSSAARTSPIARTFIAPDDGNADDRTVLAGAARDAGGTGPDAGDRSHLDRARAADVRANRPARASTTSSRSGSRRSACSRTADGTAISSMRPPSSFRTSASTTSTLVVPRGWVVGATGALASDVRRPRPAARRTASSRPTSTILRGPPVRTLSNARRASRNRGCRRWTCACCSNGSTTIRTRPIVTSRRRGPRSSTTARGSAPIPTSRSRSSIRRRRSIRPSQGESTGGMEYPTLFTAGTRWYIPWAQSPAGERDGARSRPSVLVRRGRHQRIRTRVDGRRPQYLRDSASPG